MMIGRPATIAIAFVFAVTVVGAVVAEGARGETRREHEAQRVVNAITREFGAGPVGACFWRLAARESTLDPHKANLADPNGGSYGALQINSVWRRHGESVAHFARRMYDPAANARLAHRIYRRFGLQPWGGSCT